jgi:hypothetical protein
VHDLDFFSFDDKITISGPFLFVERKQNVLDTLIENQRFRNSAFSASKASVWEEKRQHFCFIKQGIRFFVCYPLRFFPSTAGDHLVERTGEPCQAQGTFSPSADKKM